MEKTYVNIDSVKLLNDLRKKFNFNYQKAKAKRIKNKKGYDTSKDIKIMRKKLSTDSFGHFIARLTNKDKNDRD